MKLFRLILFLLIVGLLPAFGADRVTAIVTITNAPLGNTNSITINASSRTWTNSVTASPGTLIQQTNSVPWSATNLLDQLTDYRISQFHVLGQSASNTVRIIGVPGEGLTVSVTPGWAVVTYTTNTVATPTAVVRVPFTVEFDTNRARIASQLVDGVSDYATNGFKTNATALANYLSKGASPLQTVTAPVHFSSVASAAYAQLTNANLVNATNRGYIAAVTNGYWTNGILDAPTITNLFAPGSGANSVDISGTASGSSSTSVGYSSTASGSATVALGTLASATDSDATALGTDATASGGASLAVGAAAAAAGSNSIAIGVSAAAADYNSVAIGAFAATTDTNQIVLGSSEHRVVVPGLLTGNTSTNSTFKGTNVLDGRLDLASRANSALANGNNAGVVLGTNVYIRLSGPSGNYTINGFAAEQDGSWHIIEADNPTSSLTIANQSGTDPTAANRIVTGTGADVVITNNPALFEAIYNASAGRWRLKGVWR